MQDKTMSTTILERQQNACEPPDHLLQPPGETWGYWKKVMLRSAGFPAELVLRLASPDAAAAADRALDVESRLEAARRDAFGRINQALDGLREQGAWDDEGRRKPLLAVQRALSKGNAAKALELAPSLADPSLGESIAVFARVETEHAAARAELASAYENALTRQSEELRRIASRGDFQEAVIWQNRTGFNTGLSKLESEPSHERSGRQRQREELAASYLQRYCVKNDTIGFFGPTAWGSFGADGSPLTCRPGPRLLARREVYLEDWGLDELAKALLAGNGLLRRWLKPRRLPSVALHGTTLYLADKPMEVSTQTAALVEACDGQRTARELAVELSAHPRRGFAQAEDVYRMLGELHDQQILVWNFEIPIGPHAQDVLRRQIENVGDASQRQLALAALDELERCRREIAGAAGDAGRLNRAIGELEETFTRLTGTVATRKGGQTYGGRTLIYEECLRDLDLEIGPELSREIETPLALLLRSARWCMAQTAATAHQVFREIYDELREEHRTPLVHIGYFWKRVAPCFFGDEKEKLEVAIVEMQRRWREILGVGPSVRRLDLSSADLAPRVEEAFAVSGPLAPLSFYHSPDLMISAPSPEAIRDGDYQLVLGEWHPGRNTLNTWVFMSLAPTRDELFSWIDRDLPHQMVVPLPPRDNPRITTRTHRAHLSTKDFFLPPPDALVAVPPAKAILMSNMLVEDTKEGLVVRTFDGRQRFEILDFFTEFLLITVVSAFKLLGTADHWPRITIDRLIVQREAWSAPAEELRFADLKDPGERFLAARRWARERGIPRFVFVKTPAEEKPFYLDFESPIYVDILSKSIRQSREEEKPTISFSEMVPGPDQLWVTDAEGQRYTGELRMVIVDQLQRLARGAR